MPFLDADRTTLHYVDRPADPDAPPGADLLFLHGFGVTGAVWEPLWPFLPRGHRAVTFDARNHGRSSTTTTSSIADNLADVASVVDGLGLDRPVLVGSSVGAIFATEFARLHPGTIGAAVLVGGLAHTAAVRPDLAAANRAMVEGYATDLIGTATRSVPTWFGPFVGPRVHSWAVDMVRSLRVPDLTLLDEMDGYDPRPYLPAITTDLHYVHGRLDAIPFTVVEQAAALGPHTTVTVIDDAAHMPHVELPGRFAEVLTRLVPSGHPHPHNAVAKSDTHASRSGMLPRDTDRNQPTSAGQS